MRGRIHIALVSVLVFALSTASADQKEDFLTTAVKGNMIECSYGGKVRLSGGHPLAGNHDLSPRAITAGASAFRLQTASGRVDLDAIATADAPIVTFFLSADSVTLGASEYFGMFFSGIPGFDRGVTIWRYKPWSSWSKPRN